LKTVAKINATKQTFQTIHTHNTPFAIGNLHKMKNLLRALGAIVLLFSVNAAHAQGTVPFALSQQVDVNGKPVAGALLYTYVVGTVAQPQNTYQDSGLTIQNPWPLQADQTGRFPMFYLANGYVHVRLTDGGGNVIFDNPSVLVIGASGGSSGSGVDATSVLSSGDLKVKYGTGPIAGFVRANGMTIGNAVSGATERQNADTQNLFVYLYNADANLVVCLAANCSGQRTGNALNDFNANKTIALPDWRGKSITALSDMGNSAWSGFTSTYANCTPTTLGAACGNQSAALATTNLPAISYTPAGTNSASAVSVAVSATSGTQYAFTNNGGSFAGGGGNPAGTAIGTLSVSGSGSGTASAQTFFGTPASLGGSATPFTNVPPSMLATFYIKL
jgi:hypothetical protein